MRKIVQLVSHGDELLSLCDDGTVWGFRTSDREWVRVALPECLDPPQGKSRTV